MAVGLFVKKWSYRVSNPGPSRHKHDALPLSYRTTVSRNIQFILILTEMAVSFFMLRSARGGIRTHEAEAVDLKSTPFDRSGTSANVLLLGIEPRATAS